jgi:hypothetical protein
MNTPEERKDFEIWALKDQRNSISDKLTQMQILYRTELEKNRIITLKLNDISLKLLASDTNTSHWMKESNVLGHKLSALIWHTNRLISTFFYPDKYKKLDNLMLDTIGIMYQDSLEGEKVSSNIQDVKSFYKKSNKG